MATSVPQKPLYTFHIGYWRWSTNNVPLARGLNIGTLGGLVFGFYTFALWLNQRVEAARCRAEARLLWEKHFLLLRRMAEQRRRDLEN
jgi:hypothetical protein